MDIALIVLGLLFIVASMAFVLNPPEAWIKRAFLRRESKKQTKE
jgi:hypothetical protein